MLGKYKHIQVLKNISILRSTPFVSIYFSVKQHCTLMVSVLPNMSSDTGVLRISPVNSHNVCLASIPEVPSNTYNIQVK